MNGPGLSLDAAKRKCIEWDIMFTRHYGLVGSGNIHRWDKLAPEDRRKLLEVWEEGHDNVTREKLGGPEA